jgi:oligoribonuclease
MAKDKNALVWLDVEMTGLDPDRDRILELAIIVTDAELRPLGEGGVWVVHHSNRVLNAMDDWNKDAHGKSGLIDRVRASTLSLADVEEQALAFIKRYVPEGKSPMCGSSIWQDRRFLVRHMPKLESYFFYRNIDVSTLKELCKRWAPDVAKSVKKAGRHEALADIQESIDELKYYRANFLKY